MGYGRGTALGYAISVSAVLALVAGCGGKTNDEGSAIGSGGSGGGLVGTTTWPSAGGSVTASGGNGAVGGFSALTSGGTVNAGGAAASGGSVGVGGGTGGLGGKNGLGGALPTGGKPAIGGAPATGGKSAVGGEASTGGKSGVGGVSSTGGKVTVGGGVGTGGVGTGGVGTGGVAAGGVAAGGVGTAGASSAGAAGVAGTLLAAFCQGDKSKVLFQGKQEVLAPATSYQSSLVMDCCMSYGVNLHTRSTLGFDIAIETIWSAGGITAPSVITLGASTPRVSAEVRSSTDPSSPHGVPAEGTASVFGMNPFEVGLCLSLYKTAALFYGTFIYVPKISLWAYQNRARFQIFLLNDSSITQRQAIEQGLGAVELTTYPVLDLSRIAYVSSSSNEIGFNPGKKIGDLVRGAVTGSIIQGVPFVIVADGERITLGTFTSSASSIGYGLPTIFVENIETDWLTFETVGGSSNPLTDPRVVAALTATGTLIP